MVMVPSSPDLLSAKRKEGQGCGERTNSDGGARGSSVRQTDDLEGRLTMRSRLAAIVALQKACGIQQREGGRERERREAKARTTLQLDSR